MRTRQSPRRWLERNRKGSRWSSCLDSDCLFPREQGATGMNSAVLTASLTGRIQFFYCVCVAANYTTTATSTSASSCCVHPSFAQLLPRYIAEHSLDSGSRLETRVRAPGRTVRPSLQPQLRHPGRCPSNLRWRSGRPRADGGARPARGASELVRPRSPSKISCHRRPASRRPRDPYPLGPYCRVHANRRRARHLTRRAHASLGFPSRYAARACEGPEAVMDLGRHGVTGVEVTTRTRVDNPIGSAAAHSRLSPPR